MKKIKFDIKQEEKELGLFVKVFTGEGYGNVNQQKAQWFAKNSHLVAVKEKERSFSGRGRVVGKWRRTIIATTVIRKDKLEELKELRRKLNKN